MEAGRPRAGPGEGLGLQQRPPRQPFDSLGHGSSLPLVSRKTMTMCLAQPSNLPLPMEPETTRSGSKTRLQVAEEASSQVQGISRLCVLFIPSPLTWT